MTEPLLSVRDLHVRFASPTGEVHAVRGVDLDVAEGETLAIVGESGSGKSALAKAILHLHQPPFTPKRTRIEGEILLNGSGDLVAATPRLLRRTRAQAVGMIFQDALSALNPVRRVGRQIDEALRQADPSQSAAQRNSAILDIIAAMGLPEPPRIARSFPHQLSGGQCQRIMIALAAIRHPKLLIADEPTTALDVTVQAQILRLLKALQRERGMTLFFITHDLGVVADIADRVAVMYAGQIVELRDAEGLFTDPHHPYTKGLLASRPGATHGTRLKGFAPSNVAQIEGCAFRPRCPEAADRCAADQVLAAKGAGSVRCWRGAEA